MFKSLIEGETHPDKRVMQNSGLFDDEGAEDLENIVGWLPGPRDNKILRSVSLTNEGDASAVKTEKPPQIDRAIDKQWEKAEAIGVNRPRLEGARLNLAGDGRLLYDNEKLYIMAVDTDETNLKHKRLRSIWKQLNMILSRHTVLHAAAKSMNILERITK